MKTEGDFGDDLLNFSLNEVEEGKDKHHTTNHTFPKDEKEELDWFTNLDEFPSIDTDFDVFLYDPIPNPFFNNTPSKFFYDTPNPNPSIDTYTIGNNSYQLFAAHPKRPRNKIRRKRRTNLNTFFMVNMGRKCKHCGVNETPQWRPGPMGPKTLCNACGVRYMSGRLLPEYRPANSPTFSPRLHSNSHRKILEMRRKKMKGKC